MAKKKQNLSSEEILEQALVPEQEWSYKVPANWVWTYWRNCGKLIAGSGFSPQYQGFTEFEIPFYKVGSLKYSDSNGYVFDETNTINDDMRKSLKATLLQPNSLIFAKIGEAIRLNRRSLNHLSCCIDNNLMAFVPNETCNYRYSYFWSCHKEFYDLSNATTVPAIRKSDLESILFPLPPLAEQHRIVDRIESFFEKLDQARERIQDALDSFETRKAGILRKAFRGELTGKWREDNGVGMESWAKRQISEVCEINPSRTKTNDIDDNLPVTFVPMNSVSEVYGKIEVPIERRIFEVKKGYTNFSEGDVLFAKITPCMENGKAAIVGSLRNGIGYGSTEFFVLRCSDKIHNEYLYYVLRNQSFRDEAKHVMSGAVGQQRVPKSFLERYVLELPTIPEQREIARIIGDIFNKLHNSNDLYDLVDNIDLMKKSILARAFRGELGTNDPQEENAVELLKEIIQSGR